VAVNTFPLAFCAASHRVFSAKDMIFPIPFLYPPETEISPFTATAGGFDAHSVSLFDVNELIRALGDCKVPDERDLASLFQKTTEILQNGSNSRPLKYPITVCVTFESIVQ
jgi:hypothetical protein